MKGKIYIFFGHIHLHVFYLLGANNLVGKIGHNQRSWKMLDYAQEESIKIEKNTFEIFMNA